MVGFLIAEAVRDLRRAGRVAVSAILLITLALAAVGAFSIVTSNLGDAVAQWRDRVRIIVYLKQEPADGMIAPLMGRVLRTPGVASAAYVSRTQALISLRRVLGRDAGVLDQLSSNPLSASIEVTPTADAATPDDARLLLQRLSALPEVEEIAGSVDLVERLAQWQRLLALVGLGIGAVFALAAILTVTTATTLVLHARRNETEIMRLVGAPEFAVRLPLLLQGMLQGLLGGGIAVLLLLGAYRLAAPYLEPLINITIGLPTLSFLPPIAVAGLVVTGTLLGGFGGWLARGRREP